MNAPRPELQRILFIDDDADYLALVQRLVETSLRIIVDVATTSSGAEQHLNEHCYDVVICDVSLAGELGTAICARLRERDPEQPLLLLTNYDSLNTVVEEAARIDVPLYPKINVSEAAFLDLLRSLLAKRPCIHNEAVERPSNVHTIRSIRPRPIQLTSPLVAAARAVRR